MDIILRACWSLMSLVCASTTIVANISKTLEGQASPL